MGWAWSSARLPVVVCAVAAGQIACIGAYDTPERREQGLVIVLPGIEGPSAWNRELIHGLNAGGVGCAIELYDWTAPVPGGMLINLSHLERNRRVARMLRDRILAYQDAFPGRPVQLVGHSGGAGLAILTVEAFPRSSKVNSLVLLGAAVSSRHDLSRAIRRTEVGVFNLYSRRDTIYLGLGTSIFGSIDRQPGPAAGSIGFILPPLLLEAEQDIYDRLYQLKWSDGLARQGHDGGHFGWTNRRYAASCLAPLLGQLRSGAWDGSAGGRLADAAGCSWRRGAVPTPSDVGSGLTLEAASGSS